MFLFYGCLDDNTVTEYNELTLVDSVRITNLNTSATKLFTVEYAPPFYNSYYTGDSLKFSAECFYSKDEKVTVEWNYCGDQFLGVGDTLVYPSSLLNKITYAYLFVIIHREGHEGSQIYKFNIAEQDKFSNGLYILAKEGNHSVIDYVQTNTLKNQEVEYAGEPYTITTYEYKLLENNYQKSNGEVLDSPNPNRILIYGRYWTNSIQTVDKDWRKSTLMNLGDMKKMLTMEDEFVGEPKETANFANYVKAGTYMNYVFDNVHGYIYAKVDFDKYPGTGSFSSLPLSFDDPNDSPDLGPQTIVADTMWGVAHPSYGNTSLIYEKSKKRFLLISGLTATYYEGKREYSHIFTLDGDYPEDAVNLNNVDKELYGVFYTFERTGLIYFVFKDGAGGYIIQKVNITTSTSSLSHSLKFNTNNIKVIQASSELAEIFDNCDPKKIYVGQSASSNPLFFCPYQNKLYSFNLDNDVLSELTENCDLSAYGNLDYAVSTDRWYTADAAGPVSRYFVGRVFYAFFNNFTDLKVIKIYDDPAKTTPQLEVLVEKHYSDGVADCCKW